MPSVTYFFFPIRIHNFPFLPLLPDTRCLHNFFVSVVIYYGQAIKNPLSMDREGTIGDGKRHSILSFG